MNEDQRTEIVSFAIKKLTPLIDKETGKIGAIHFKKSELMKSLGLENKSTLNALSDKQLQQFINAALMMTGTLKRECHNSLLGSVLILPLV